MQKTKSSLMWRANMPLREIRTIHIDVKLFLSHCHECMQFSNILRIGCILQYRRDRADCIYQIMKFTNKAYIMPKNAKTQKFFNNKNQMNFGKYIINM